jgi:hypothetical protein
MQIKKSELVVLLEEEISTVFDYLHQAARFYREPPKYWWGYSPQL